MILEADFLGILFTMFVGYQLNPHTAACSLTHSLGPRGTIFVVFFSPMKYKVLLGRPSHTHTKPKQTKNQFNLPIAFTNYTTLFTIIAVELSFPRS